MGVSVNQPHYHPLMNMDKSRPKTDATQQFEHDLRELIMTSFADGAQLEDTWTITVPVTDAPNWRVTIEKTYTDEDPAYEPRFLKE